MIKRLIHQEDIIITKIYAPNNIAPKYMEQKLTELKGEIDKLIIVVGDLRTLVLVINRTSKKSARIQN